MMLPNPTLYEIQFKSTGKLESARDKIVSQPLTDLRGTMPIVGIVTLTVVFCAANAETQEDL